ncbi:MAG: hypothetical protein U9R05_01470 [Chloroflexota bacterium]|nr:hypothetical protein [Chloroflexota bacterium]
MYPDSEILFPPRCIPRLHELRGPQWQHLVERVVSLPHNHEEVLAFGLLMIRLSSCLTCDLDSYRAALGCCTCARRTISGFKGDDKELLERYHRALENVRTYLQKDDLPEPVRLMLQEELRELPGR